MPDIKKGPHYAHFDGMCWPLPSERIRDIDYKMRHFPQGLTRGDILLAAEDIDLIFNGATEEKELWCMMDEFADDLDYDLDELLGDENGAYL